MIQLLEEWEWEVLIQSESYICMDDPMPLLEPKQESSRQNLQQINWL